MSNALPNYHGGTGTSISKDGPFTFLFAPEIETALLGLLWHEPERLAEIKRQLDPGIHFLQPHCRYLLEAIDLAYRELGDVDFAVVIQVLRELGRLEEVGGLEGAGELYRAGEFVNSPIWTLVRSDQLFSEYLRLLKDYALTRQEKPPRRAYFFTGGKATLLLDKSSPRQDRYSGEASIRGRWYSVRAEVGPQGEFINLRFEPK